MQDRVTYLHAADDFECYISAKKNWLLLILIPLLLSANADNFYTAFALIIHSLRTFEFLFRVFWFLISASFAFILIAIWFWTAFGREIITIDSRLLTIKHDVFGHGNTKAFQMKEISNVRIAEFHNVIVFLSNFFFWNADSGMIAFDYKGETFRFGIRLGEIESYKLMKILERYFEE